MKYPYTVEDFVRDHPEHEGAANSDLFRRVNDKINRAYYSGLNGEERTFRPPNVQWLPEDEGEYLTQCISAMRDAYLQGKSDREAIA